jgi:hypothetical protein
MTAPCSLLLKSCCAFSIAALAAACASPSADRGLVSSASVDDVQSLTRLADGHFDALCRDGHHETVTSDQVRADQVCVNGSGTTSGGPAEPQTDDARLKAIASLGNTTAAISDNFRLAASLVETSGDLLRALPGLGVLQDMNVLSRLAAAAAYVDAVGDGAGAGYALCTQYNSPGYCTSGSSLGYGLCTLANSPGYCTAQSTIGYGLCTLKNSPGYCSTDGTIGYGVCALANSPGYCAAQSGPGYGLCALKNSPGYCATDGTVGYGLCAMINSPGYCASQSSIGYAACASVNSPGYCATDGTVGYGLCALHNSPGYCATAGSIAYGICSETNNPGYCAQ